MDELDIKILRILSLDARTPFSNIAKQIGIGTDSVIRRFKKLQKEDVIQGSTIILDSKKLGYQNHIGFGAKIYNNTDKSKIKLEIKKLPNVVYIAEMMGEYNLYFEAVFRKFEEVGELVNKIRRIKEINHLEAMVYLENDWPIPWHPLYDFGLPNNPAEALRGFFP